MTVIVLCLFLVVAVIGWLLEWSRRTSAELLLDAAIDVLNTNPDADWRDLL